MTVALSILIPAYNRLWALPKAIESCRSTRSPHEIIVVDDGSTDGTSDWLSQQVDVVHVRTDNWGKCWAANHAFSLAKGEYVRFLDSDDWLEPSANDDQLAIAAASGADIVVGGYRTFDERSDSWVEAPWVSCDDFMAQQLGETQPGHYTAFLFKRSFIASVPHRQEYTPNDDRMFILEAAARQPRLAVYNGFSFTHFHHKSGRLQEPAAIDVVPQLVADLKVYRKALALLEARHELTERHRRAPTRSRLWPLAHSLARYDRQGAIDLVKWIHELDPSFEVPGQGILPTLYRTLGFEATTHLLAARRAMLFRK